VADERYMEWPHVDETFVAVDRSLPGDRDPTPID
jgi:hypothetical protein